MRSQRLLPLLLLVASPLLVAAFPREADTSPLGALGSIHPSLMNHGCAPPCRCAPMSLKAIFGMVVFVKEVIVNCTDTGLTSLPGPVYHEVYALLLPHNNITELGPRCFASDMQVTDVRELDLRDNAISKIHPDALHGLHSLTSIAMDRNMIQSLASQLFEDCPEIEYVSLGSNPLTIPASGPFLNAPSLAVLDLSNCSLRSLPDATFSETPLLRVLYLADNPDIGVVNTSALAQLEHLHGVTLMRNSRFELEGSHALSIRELGASGACLAIRTKAVLENLTKLSARGCGLTELPSILSHSLDTVGMLLLGKNSFTHWDNTTSLPQLSLLALDYNNITRLEPTAFAQAPLLSVLNLSCNALEPPERGPLLVSKHLHSLDLLNCSLGRLPEDALSALPQLAVIDLSNNGLTQLPSGLFQHVEGLMQVLLDDNGLESLPEGLFDRNPQLLRLHLSGNPLLLSGEHLALPPAAALTLLELDRMGLSSVQSSWFQGMPELTNLSLADNQLSTISVTSFEKLGSLQQIKLTGNPLQCNADLVPFYEWTKKNRVDVVAKCAQPRGNWQLMEHLHFDGQSPQEQAPGSTRPPDATRPPAPVTLGPKPTIRVLPDVVTSPPGTDEPPQQAVKAASVGGSSGGGSGSLWVVLLVGALVGGVAGAILTALLSRRLRCPSRANGFLPIRLRDTASVAEEYGDEVRLGS